MLNITKNDQESRIGSYSCKPQEIASNLEIINLNDSLIRLSTLNVKEKKELLQ
ncbi:MAG: hypothetical protein IPJ43_11140 [Saprospiraceae bacterium]|nr:hypothetical protein [Saprospiraceae bacterium]